MDSPHLESIERSPLKGSASRDHSLAGLGSAPSPEKLAGLFQTLLSVQKSAAGSKEYFESTAKAIVELVGLDHGLVMLREQESWEVAAKYSIRTDAEFGHSQTVMDRVLRTKQTCFESFAEPSAVQSLSSVQAYVASPVMNASDEVVGVLFGSRDLRPGDQQLGIAALEAHVVQLLAGIVSASLARADIEAEASRFRVQLEQFASPTLVDAMQKDPSILEARDRNISVLFADIRGFTGLSERLGAEQTYKLIRNVMDKLSGCILDYDGLIIDYSGDGIAAMWNAPTDQPNHAELACLAALDMQREMKKLSEFWGYLTGENVVVGIGINSGDAQVGNSGSRWRMKYSALGHSVNLASRVEGATKFFDAPILLTESTHHELGDQLSTMRIGPVKFWGIEEFFQIYALLDEDEKSTSSSAEYSSLLELYERNEMSAAKRLATSILAEAPDDRLANVLNQEIERHLEDPDRQPAIRLKSK